MNLDELIDNQFYEFSLIIFLATVAGAIGCMLRQPLIVSFIAVGILVRPSVLNILNSEYEIDLLAEMGIAILLFVVGLKLDINLIKSTGKVALMTGLGQVNIALMKLLEHQQFEGRLAVTAKNDAAVQMLRDEGAEYILEPYKDSAKKVAKMFSHKVEKDEVKQERESDREEIRKADDPE